MNSHDPDHDIGLWRPGAAAAKPIITKGTCGAYGPIGKDPKTRSRFGSTGPAQDPGLRTPGPWDIASTALDSFLYR